MILPQIKITDLDNDFYQVRSVKETTANVLFVDFKYSNLSTQAFAQYPQTIGPDVFQKTIRLKTLALKETFNFKDAKDELTNEFISIITKLGKEHREIEKMDLDDEIKKKNPRKILSKLNNISNYIAIKGRIGPVQYFIVNAETYHLIIRNFYDMEFVFEDGMLKIGNIKVYIDNSVEDNIIIAGRKNSVDQPGVHCLILTDENGNIQFKDINGRVAIDYAIVELGFFPHLNFFSSNVRTLSYFRKLKLQKINNSNE